MNVEQLINDLHIYQFQTRAKWKDIASYLGVSAVTISLFKEGRRELAIDKLAKLEKLIYGEKINYRGLNN